jgi:RNA polymerase sigma-70 factor, ECF subfamily
VAGLLAVVWYRRGVERSVELVQVNGGPGLLVRDSGQIDGVLAVRVENGHVTGLLPRAKSREVVGCGARSP